MDRWAGKGVWGLMQSLGSAAPAWNFGVCRIRACWNQVLPSARGNKYVNTICRKIWLVIYIIYFLSITLRDWFIAASQRGHIIFIILKLK